jgi:hypothetical protein
MKTLVPAAMVLFVCLICTFALAESDESQDAYVPGKELFGTLNYRSKYYSDSFPEPFRVEDTAIDNELRFDWEHDEGNGSRANTEVAEIQKSFSIVTFEIQAPYSSSTGLIAADSDDGVAKGSSRGFSDVELAARLPVIQSVSKSGLIDNSLGFNLEADIPTNSPVGKNAGITPGIFDDLAIGDGFTIQSLFTFSHSFGTLQTGRASFGYELAFAYAIEDEDFKIPHVERLIPSLELLGITALDGITSGHNALTGTAGVRAEFKPVWKLQPSFGVGYIFPIDGGGRSELHWGIITSLTFEF